MAFGAWSSVLRALKIPQDAGDDDPRIVLDSNDPLVAALGQDAGMAFYFDNGRGFVIAVEHSGGVLGQLHLFGVSTQADPVTLIQVLDVDYDYSDSVNGSSVSLGGTVEDVIISPNGQVRIGAASVDISGPAMILRGSGLDGTAHVGGIVAVEEILADSAGFTTPAQVGAITFPAVQGADYWIYANLGMQKTAAGNVRGSIVEDDTAGAVLDASVVEVVAPSTTQKYPCIVEGGYTHTAANGSKTFVVTGEVLTGAGTGRIEAAGTRRSNIRVAYLGVGVL